MLKHLYIENYTLIQKLEIDFSVGYTVITGETGAGKSILIGALSLITGQRADTQTLLDKTKKCIIEGTFEISEYNLENFFVENDLDYEQNTLLRREINQHGKSRAFINDTPVNLNVLKELSGYLIDIHSQYTTLALNDSGFQLAIIDSYDDNNKLINKCKSRFNSYNRIKKHLDEIINEEKQKKTEVDYNQFLLNEIEDAQLIENEQEELEEQSKILLNAEEIKSTLFKASQQLAHSNINILEVLNELCQDIDKISKFHSKISEVSNRLNSNYIDMKDIAGDIETIENSVEYNPDQLEQVNSRLDLIYKLQNKHSVSSVNELLVIKSQLSDKLLDVNSLSNEIKKLKSQEEELYKQLLKIAEEISELRRKSFPKIEKQILKTLFSVGMPHAKFKIKHEILDEISMDGIDKVKFLFNANIGGDLMDLSKVASGGELSRLMLSVKSLISTRNLLPTLIFDEIDIGVSGDIAAKVGSIMKQMSHTMQIISITHLPQIAGKGDHHFLVYKEIDQNRTFSAIKKLNQHEQVQEIAKMLSADNVSKAAIETAKELLSN